MSVPQRLQNGQAPSPVATVQQSHFCLCKANNPRVSFHRAWRRLCCSLRIRCSRDGGQGIRQHWLLVVLVVLCRLQHWAFFTEQIKPLCLDLGDKVGRRPGDVRLRPGGWRPGPDAAALERRRYLNDVSVKLFQNSASRTFTYWSAHGGLMKNILICCVVGCTREQLHQYLLTQAQDRGNQENLKS